MRSLRLPLALAAFGALAAAAGCSSSSSSNPAAPGSGDDGGTDGGNLTVASFHMQATVAGGQEMFKCQFVTLPDIAGYLVAGNHNYTPGSHHLLMYTTDLSTIPPGGDQIQDCYEGTGSNIMSHVRGVLYGGQTPTGSEQYPQGIGIPTKASQVLLFQVHYLNASASSLQANVDVNLTIDDGSDITTPAGILFFYDPFIDVPPAAKAQAAMRCPITSDVTLLYASSHYHARGVNYGAFIDTDPNNPSTTPFYTSNSWSSPPNQSMSMQVKAGSRLRFECDYDNTMGTQEYFQGPSAQTNEMCMFIGAYYPEMGQLTDYCLQGGDMYGTGTANCSASLTCLQQCMASGNVGGGGSIAGKSVSDCQQTCFVQSCPTASASLMPLVQCLQNSCSTECGAGGSGCATCVASKCGSQYSACQAHTCN